MLNNFTHIKWCSFCNSTQAEGILKMDTGSDGIIDFPACRKCAKEQLPTGMTLDDLRQQQSEQLALDFDN